MGGYGSGEYQSASAKQLVENAIVLSISEFASHGFSYGVPGSGKLTWPNGWIIDFTLVRNTLRLRYERGRRGELDDQLVTMAVQIVATRPNYGGARAWFLCPKCSRRCAKLYIPFYGYEFCCRQCAQLVHQSTRAMTGAKIARYMGKLLVREAERAQRVNEILAREAERRAKG